ncbi:SGNH hydrolase domain-containing protein, partial [Lelliottia amnigena]|uniref:SGNH hydrolase domain-containing protein n=1 Tax=Lelliottia amnigena TaxID=61646 RepID=UPI00197DC8B7
DNYDKFLDKKVDDFRNVLVSRIYNYQVNYIDVYNLGCDSGCSMQNQDGTLMMFDKDHLTKLGADKVASMIK